MGETDKPFACPLTECGMRFTNEDHLTVHKKKHDMCLNFSNGQKMNIFVADQTPTPTRFIRNCEEVGLFQDLQNVNPFEEQFRKAAEAAKSGTTPLHEAEPMCGQVDDTLHTPQVYQIENHQASVHRTINECSPNCVPTLQAPTPRPRCESAYDKTSESPTKDESSSSATATKDNAVQLLLRLPDGKMVKLSAVEMAESETTSSSTQSSTVLTVPSIVLDQPTASGQTSRTVLLSSTAARPRSLDAATPKNPSNNSSDRMALAKQKLKQALSANRKKVPVNSSQSTAGSVDERQGRTLLSLKSCLPTGQSEAASTPVSKRQREPSGSAGSSGEDVQNKRQRFLERNRAAASRCRQKRKHWITTLQRRADITNTANQQLVAEVNNLRAEVAQLKTLLLAHRDCPVTKAMCQAGMLQVIEASLPDLAANRVPTTLDIAPQPLQSVINVTPARQGSIVILQPSTNSVVPEPAVSVVKPPAATPTLQPLIIPLHAEPAADNKQVKNSLLQVSPPQPATSTTIIASRESDIHQLSKRTGVLKFVRQNEKETVIVENINIRSGIL